MVEEMMTLDKNNTWEFTTLSEGNRTVGCKWVFTLKYNSDGMINRYKAQLVAKGFTQSYGVDYFETFSPVAKLTSIKVILSFSSKFDWPLCHVDVKNAFLHGDLKEEIYMDPPPAFVIKGRDKCLFP